jgi:hypothetical protein
MARPKVVPLHLSQPRETCFCPRPLRVGGSVECSGRARHSYPRQAALIWGTPISAGRGLTRSTRQIRRPWAIVRVHGFGPRHGSA